jgi:hypothetical protein
MDVPDQRDKHRKKQQATKNYRIRLTIDERRTG